MSKVTAHGESSLLFLIFISVITIIGISILGTVDVIKTKEKAEQNADYIIAPKVHTCTDEQMVKVESETLFCSNETGYFASYCYGTAIMRNCTKNSTTEN